MQHACNLMQLAGRGKEAGFSPNKAQLELLEEACLCQGAQPGPPMPPRAQPKIVKMPAEAQDGEALQLSARLMQASPEVIPSELLRSAAIDIIKALQAIGFPSHHTKQGVLTCQGGRSHSAGIMPAHHLRWKQG